MRPRLAEAGPRSAEPLRVLPQGMPEAASTWLGSRSAMQSDAQSNLGAQGSPRAKAGNRWRSIDKRNVTKEDDLHGPCLIAFGSPNDPLLPVVRWRSGRL